MSITVRCFENLTLPNCQPRITCCRKITDTNIATANNVVFMNTASDKGTPVIIVPGPQEPDTDLNDAEDQDWDFLTVDSQHRVLSVCGERLKKLLRVEQFYRQSIHDVFYKSMSEVCEPLIEVALEGKSGMLHTLCNGESLCMIAYTLRNAKERIIGAHLIYRPFKYDQKQLIQLIKQVPLSAP